MPFLEEIARTDRSPHLRELAMNLVVAWRIVCE
jgi:hypothetical protein